MRKLDLLAQIRRRRPYTLYKRGGHRYENLLNRQFIQEQKNYRNFISAIPEALDEAAAIDGASVLQTFFHIILPQLAPVTVSVIIMKGIGAWNEFAFSLYVLQKPKMYNITLTIKQYFSESSTDLNAAAAGALLGTLPTILIYLALQKYFVKGTLDSAVK